MFEEQCWCIYFAVSFELLPSDPQNHSIQGSDFIIWESLGVTWAKGKGIRKWNSSFPLVTQSLNGAWGCGHSKWGCGHSKWLPNVNHTRTTFANLNSINIMKSKHLPSKARSQYDIALRLQNTRNKYLHFNDDLFSTIVQPSSATKIIGWIRSLCW